MDPGEEEQENEEEMEFSQGVLSQLEWLERRERVGAAQRERRERRRERSQILRGKIRELRELRDGLRGKLETLAQDKSGIPWDPREVLQWRLRQLRELLKIFPLTGVSGSLSRHGLSLSLHCSRGGALLPPVPMELREHREQREQRKHRELHREHPGEHREHREHRELHREHRELHRELHLGPHGFPPWVPLPGGIRPRELRGLLGGLGGLLSAREHRREQLRLLQGRGLGGLLSAREHRREQLRLLQEEFSECLQGIPCSNSLCNLLSFRCRIPRENSQNSQISGNVLEFRARLRYGDPLRSLPTDVEIDVEGIPDPAPSLSVLFRRRPLPAALREIREWGPGMG